MLTPQVLLALAAALTIGLMLGYILGCDVLGLWRRAEAHDRIDDQHRKQIADLTAENLALRRDNYRGTLYAITDQEHEDL